MIEQGMTSERCAEIIGIGISNKLRESWAIKDGLLWYSTYIAHYNPWFFGKFMRPLAATNNV